MVLLVFAHKSNFKQFCGVVFQLLLSILEQNFNFKKKGDDFNFPHHKCGKYCNNNKVKMSEKSKTLIFSVFISGEYDPGIKGRVTNISPFHIVHRTQIC